MTTPIISKHKMLSLLEDAFHDVQSRILHKRKFSTSSRYKATYHSSQSPFTFTVEIGNETSSLVPDEHIPTTVSYYLYYESTMILRFHLYDEDKVILRQYYLPRTFQEQAANLFMVLLSKGFQIALNEYMTSFTPESKTAELMPLIHLE